MSIPESHSKNPQQSPGSVQPDCSARLDVYDPDWSTLFTLRLELAASNHGCGILEMFGRMLGCKRKDIRKARKIDRSWTKKGKPNTEVTDAGT